jgi:uncharacterized protein (DUF305 family)
MKRLLALLAALATAVTLAGCSSGGAKADSTLADVTSTSHDAADVTFAQDMIPHHRQAIAMAGLAAARASSPEVKALATRIEKAQDPEIITMTGWLASWGEPTAAGTPASGMGGMNGTAMPRATAPMATDTAGMGMGGSAMGAMPTATAGASAMPGMMTDADLAKLTAATGRDFDRMFLTMMITHHRGAVTMATDEERDGRYAPAIALATTIRTSQTTEITEMSTLLAKL